MDSLTQSVASQIQNLEMALLISRYHCVAEVCVLMVDNGDLAQILLEFPAPLNHVLVDVEKVQLRQIGLDQGFSEGRNSVDFLDLAAVWILEAVLHHTRHVLFDVL